MEGINIEYKYYRFGSNDSIDIDLLVDHPNALGKESDKNLIKELVGKYPSLKNVDLNIIKIADGKVVCSIPSKGTPDAVNNSLFHTYHLHHQSFDLPLKGPLERNILVAIVRCIRAVLTSFKKVDNGNFYKNVIRPILRNGSFSKWLSACDMLTFDAQNQIEINEINFRKKLAFHICQTSSLIQGMEIYTKKDLIFYHPEVKDIINRIHCVDTSHELNTKLKMLTRQIQDLDLVFSDDHVQLGSTIVNLKTEESL